jgi:hypothetical protein
LIRCQGNDKVLLAQASAHVIRPGYLINSSKWTPARQTPQ